MRIVDIYRRRPDAVTERLARLTVPKPGAPAELEVFIPKIREGFELMIAEGAPSDKGGWFYLRDGEAFLDAALAHFHGSRFWAEEVEPGS